MADVAVTKLKGVGNSDVFEYSFDATNKTIEPLQLDPSKVATIAVQTTGAATVAVNVFLEDPDNAGAAQFPYVAAAATADSVDYIQSTLGPISGIDMTGTVTGGDTAFIQIVQSDRK